MYGQRKEIIHSTYISLKILHLLLCKDTALTLFIVRSFQHVSYLNVALKLNTKLATIDEDATAWNRSNAWVNEVPTMIMAFQLQVVRINTSMK